MLWGLVGAPCASPPRRRGARASPAPSGATAAPCRGGRPRGGSRRTARSSPVAGGGVSGEKPVGTAAATAVTVRCAGVGMGVSGPRTRSSPERRCARRAASSMSRAVRPRRAATRGGGAVAARRTARDGPEICAARVGERAGQEQAQKPGTSGVAGGTHTPRVAHTHPGWQQRAPLGNSCWAWRRRPRASCG